MREGILVAGNWIIDHVKVIDSFPEEEKLVNIIEEYHSNGGSAYNIIKNFAKLKVGASLQALGLVGDDEYGSQIIKECESLGVNCKMLLKTSQAGTAYTDVMTVKSTGKRTFFHHRGANALLDIDHFQFNNINAKIFHLGYLLLLDQLDIIETDGTSRASKVLKEAKRCGFITSVDIVSEKSDRFKKIIPSSLPFIDYLFVNEFEAEMITGVRTVENGNVIIDRCYEAASKIIAMGVKEWVILHFPSGTVALSKNSQFLFQTSVNLPDNIIKGAVGAGDAFAAGVLSGIEKNMAMEKCLEIGVCVAASSLLSVTSSDGILALNECLQLAEEFGFRKQ